MILTHTNTHALKHMPTNMYTHACKKYTYIHMCTHTHNAKYVGIYPTELTVFN